ncbi:MBL fold metallo-hydrolase [Alkalihalobacillus sp. 1P02AB]|uniref:MBL fold metallo-hydrolase n=1 Tax=Alkalihalobacillus sp. 1P02AB TaxID=3132260 RepID=UPI0039A4D4CA
MPVQQMPLGPLQTNAYILHNEKKQAIIFDPGSEGQKVIRWLKQEALTPLAIILTHAHFDHIGAVDELRDEFRIPVYLHKKEKDWLSDPSKNGSGRFIGDSIKIKPADILITNEADLQVGPFLFQVFYTPGHSPGSVSFYYPKEAIVFSGDVLFSQSIGRTDLPGGDHETLLKSIHDKLLELPEDTVVACGHGQVTTIGMEMDSNPFLSGF